MSKKPSILLTGFERFNGFQVNTSQVIVEHFSRYNPLSTVDIHTKVLPVSFVYATQVVNDILDKIKPDLVLHLGLLAGATAFSLERVASNIDDTDTPDNNHEIPVKRRIIPLGPITYESTWPTDLIIERLTKKSIPAYVSYDAGTYVCNHVFYTTMHYIAEKQAKMVCGLIHLPCLPEEASRFTEPLASMPLSLVLTGMKCVLDTLRDYLCKG